MTSAGSFAQKDIQFDWDALPAPAASNLFTTCQRLAWIPLFRRMTSSVMD